MEIIRMLEKVESDTNGTSLVTLYIPAGADL
jgi:hypothetical protein